jgi:hypothetical protein
MESIYFTFMKKQIAIKNMDQNLKDKKIRGEIEK